ncbi:nucleoside phosphorylase domain-containing protein [Trichoderma sp. SZMC 28014]
MPRLDQYTVGWITALPLEMAAAIDMLDEVHGKPNIQDSHDCNNYILGRIGLHHIVIACLPSGIYGTTSAAVVAAQMLSSFRSIKFGLMVGIGGGVPSLDHDIRLGDVVVGKPSGRTGGVIQYDFGKTTDGGEFNPQGCLNKPPQILLTAVSTMQALHITRGNRNQAILVELDKAKILEQRPGQDRLFEADYSHANSSVSCDHCNPKRLVPRSSRPNATPVVFYGIIASGNQVIKDAKTRDQLGQRHGVLCFEMEAAGLMDNFPCLVIRGICDYADSHKSKEWQAYAAITASAYAKELLGLIPRDDRADAHTESNIVWPVLLRCIPPSFETYL